MYKRQALTRKLRDQVLADVESKGMAKSQMSILDALLKLRQICCHPRLLKVDMPGFSTGSLPSGKFEAFKDMIFDVVEGGHKVLVFSQFVQMLQIIRGWLQLTDIPFCYLDAVSYTHLLPPPSKPPLSLFKDFRTYRIPLVRQFRIWIARTAVLSHKEKPFSMNLRKGFFLFILQYPNLPKQTRTRNRDSIKSKIFEDGGMGVRGKGGRNFL